MAKHDFGIIERFENDKWYVQYEPERYNCISVDMEVMDKIFETKLDDLMKIKAFACISTQPIYGLDECGVTLIPPDSLPLFCELIAKANSQYKLQQLDLLTGKIQDAMKENKYLIHFGI